MAPVSHQTIKLSKGKHASPREGACVLELASMLAGEPFTDYPTSVCPVIGSFLRAYNDAVDDGRRQDLYGFAAQVVGSRSGIGVQRERAHRLAAWALEMRRRRWTRLVALSRSWVPGLGRQRSAPSVGSFAVNAIPKHTEQTHDEVLALLDELLAIGAPQQPAAAPEVTEELPPALYPVA